MTYPEVQFVAAPEEGAEVLFDFNDDFSDAPSAIIAGSFTLGAPSVEGDPDGLGVQYGPREVGFDVLIFGNRYDALETQALMARTFMLRRRGWLRVCLDDLSAPVWLRTYTPTPSELDFSLISPDADQDAWRLEVRVSAEPFIRGERVELWAGEMKDDPAAVTNPTQVVLPDVLGDAPAPLRIEAAFSGSREHHDILLATSAVPETYDAPIVWQIGTGDGWIGAGDLSAAITDSDFSGGSYRQVTFVGGNSLAPRVWGTAPSVPPTGRYRVFLRASGGDAASSFVAQFGYRRLGENIFNGSPTATLALGNVNPTMLDLGEFDFPLPAASSSVVSSDAAPSIALSVGRLAGTSVLQLDALVLVPVAIAAVTELEAWEKSDVLVSSFGTLGPQATLGETQIWDGDEEVAFRRLAGVSDAFVAPVNRGSFPTVRPGVRNLLTLFHQVRGAGSGNPISPTSIASTAVLSVTYQPRWLYLGGG